MKARFLILALATIALTTPLTAQQKLKAGDAAPLFVAADLKGKPVDMSAMRGKVVVLTFWSTRCSICHVEIPRLNQLAARLDKTKTHLLALSMENEQKLTDYLRKNRFDFTIVPNSFGIVLQYADQPKKGFIDMGFPSYFVIDKQGRIRWRASGFDKLVELESSIASLATETGVK